MRALEAAAIHPWDPLSLNVWPICACIIFVCFIAVVATCYWDSWHWLGLELCQPAFQPRSKLDGTWPLPNLPSASLLPTKTLQSLILPNLLGLPLALQLEGEAFQLRQEILVALLLGAESGGSLGAGGTCVPCAPCRAGDAAGRGEGAGSSPGSAAQSCTCFLKRLITGA